MTTYPGITAGTTPTVAVLQAMLELIADKGADQGVTSSTTLANDSALFVPLAANAKYKVQLEVLYKGGTTGSSDLKLGFSVPSGATIAGRAITVSNPLGVATGYITQSSVLFSATNGTGNPLDCACTFTLTTSGTSGNLQIQWAQNTSSGTATTVMSGSSLTARRRS
jgi:hypothetical protein